MNSKEKSNKISNASRIVKSISKKIKSVGQEVLPTRLVQKTGIKEIHILRFKKPLTPALISIEEEFEPVEFTEKDYEEAVQRLKQHYPKIGRRVYKTPTKSWKEIYDDMLAIIEKEKWPQIKNRNQSITLVLDKC
jgi:hypothetical protein